MAILFTVCGRAGSKGFQSKNLKDFLGVPLVYYTLAAIRLWQQRAGEETEKILARARTECEKMQSAARANLERAAQWIAEEVVNDKWQS